MRILNRKGRERGVAMVEMVIVTPFLLLTLLGVAELGKAFIQYNALNKQVRDAARFVASTALLGTTGTVFISPDVEAEAQNLVVFGNVGGGGSPLLPLLSPAHVTVVNAGSSMIEVRADYPYEPLTGPFLETFGYGTDPSLALTLTASVTMRAL